MNKFVLPNELLFYINKHASSKVVRILHRCSSKLMYVFPYAFHVYRRTYIINNDNIICNERGYYIILCFNHYYNRYPIIQTITATSKKSNLVKRFNKMMNKIRSYRFFVLARFCNYSHVNSLDSNYIKELYVTTELEKILLSVDSNYKEVIHKCIINKIASDITISQAYDHEGIFIINPNKKFTFVQFKYKYETICYEDAKFQDYSDFV